MGIEWVGGEHGHPVISVELAYLHHGSIVTALVECAWNLPVRNWSGYDIERLEAAVKQLRKRYDAAQKKPTT